MKALWLIIATVIAACGSTQTRPTPHGSNMVIEKDSDEEYELIIMDPGFDRWFVANRVPISQHDLSFYENKNLQYVVAWNDLVNQQARFPSGDFPFTNRIEYNPSTDYGLELNYKLYHYFRYIESKYGARYGFPT